MNRFLSTLLLFLFFAPFLFILNATAQKAPERSIYIIFDASGSMWGKLPDESYKIHTARTVLEDFMSQDLENTEIAVRAYGHRREGDCSDTELVIPFGSAGDANKQLRTFLKDVNPKGKTPIHRSLTEALKDFGDRSGDIVLITDGIETCNADPCALVKEWKEKDIDINVHVVGFGLQQKEKDVLACISKAADTPFYEADSAQDLTEKLQSIKEVTVAAAFILRANDVAGNRIRAKGELIAEDGTVYPVSTNGRFAIPSGTYTLRAGAETLNERLYHPVEKEVVMGTTGETEAFVTLDVPPRIHIAFAEDGKPAPQISSLVYVYQDGEEQFHFRSKDIIYVDEGTYEFRAKPNDDNDLAVIAEARTGEETEVLFNLLQTVQIHVRMFASGSNQRFREHIALFQNGEEKYVAHSGNGARVLPGKYTARMETQLHSYETEIDVSGEDNQTFELTVPVGYAVIRYQHADGTPDTSDRCFVSRADKKNRIYWHADKVYPLRAGSYKVSGWSKKGDYDEVIFEVKEGQETEVILKAKG